MNLRCNILITIMMFWAFVTTNAKIPIWSIHPRYEKLHRYYGNIYAFQLNGKWGLVQSGDKELLPAICDFITPFINGYALAGTKDGNRYLLERIIDASGGVSILSDKFYLPSNNQYVSEGKLVVINNNGKYGYITTDGRIVIRCQFDNALPFKEGWAPVKQGNYTKYISEKYDKNPSHSILTVDFHYGEMTLSSCFSNGKAVIAYNKDFALIGINGRKVKKLSEADFKQLYKKNNAPLISSTDNFNEASRYSIFIKNGKSGLKEGETIVVKPQFDLFVSQYNDETLLTMLNGKYGLLKITDEEIEIRTSVEGEKSNELKVDGKGHSTSITIDYKMPSDIRTSKVLIDLGDGTYRDLTAQGSDNGIGKSLSITPVIAENAESCIIKVAIENDGIILADIEKAFTVSYPIKLRVSSPGPSTIRANENDNATFSSTIFNDSNKPVTVIATWSTGNSVTVTIPAQSCITVSDTVNVKMDCTKDISLSLSTGERVHSTINFLTYF